MNRFGIIILAVCLLSGIVYGQGNYTLKGTVTDEQNNTLPGANIYIPELHSGTATDKDGQYILSNLVIGRFKVQYSYMGYETQIRDVVITDNEMIIDIQLHPSAFHSQEVVISGGRPTSQHENAIKIETISVSSIETSGTPSLMKSIAEIPGVDAISKGDGVTTPVIRGLSTSNILVLNDGIRLGNYQFSANHPYLVDEFGIDKVEVIKGPASLLYGSDAIGGVINFIKEKPANAGSIEGDANLQYHSNTLGPTGNIGIKGSGKKFNWGLRGGIKSNMDYLQGSGDFVPNTRFNQASIKSFGGFSTSNANFRVYYDYTKMKAGMCVAPVIPVITERGRKNKIWYQDLEMHLVSSKNTLYLKALKLQANLSYQYNYRRLQGDEPEPHFTLVDAKLNTLNYEIKGNHISSERSTFFLALQGMYQQNRNQEAPEHVLPDYSLNDISISGLVQHDFNEVIHLQIGLRFDNRFIYVPEQDLHGHDHGDEGDEGKEEKIFEELERYYGNISGSIGLTYEVSEHFLLRANLASAYRTPNVAELTQDGMHGIRYEQGNRDLTSQRNYEADLSFHYHSKRIMFDIGGFYNYINNYVFLALTSDTTDDGQTIYRYEQNNATIYGLEAIAEVLATEELSIKSIYSYIRGKQSNEENLPFIPQNRLKFEIKWLRTELWKFSGFYIKAGSEIAFDQKNPATFETGTNGYTLFDAGIGFTFHLSGQPLNLDVIATNLLNRNYIDHLSTLKELGYNDPGRNVTVSIRVPFKIKD